MEDQKWFNLVDELASRYTFGDIIPHSVIRDFFNVKDPERPKSLSDMDWYTYQLEVRNKQFELLSLVDTLKNDLLERHKYCLKIDTGTGYIIVKPEDQGEYAYKKVVKDVKKDLRRAMRMIENVDPSVDHTVSRKNHEMYARLSMLGSQIKA